MGYALFIPESFSGWDADGVACGQQAGEECAESEERGGCEETTRGKGALHPVGEDGAEKAVNGNSDDHARGRADQRDTRGSPQHMRARRAQRQADAELRRALRDAVRDEAEDAHQREPQCHGREHAKQDGEEPLAAVLRVALDGLGEREGAVEGRDAVRDLLVGSDGCNRGADGVQAGERIALRADEELRPGLHRGSVRNVDGGDNGLVDAVVARIAYDADDLTPRGALRRDGLVDFMSCETGNAQLPAQGIGRGEIACRESPIDDGDEVSAAVFVRTPDAALQQWNAERSEIPLADQHHTSLRLLAIATSVDDERALNISTGRRGVDADSDRGDTGDGCDLLPDLLDIRGARFPRLKAAPLGRVIEMQRDAELHDVGGIVAEGHLRE